MNRLDVLVPTISYHASVRMQQRGFERSDILLMVLFGTPDRQHGGTTKYRFGEREAKEVGKLLDKLKNSSLVLSDMDNHVVTVQHGLG